MNNQLAQQFFKELVAEESATRKCLERIPATIGDWKPHEKSMRFDYLALLIADMPKWITAMIEQGEINFNSWEKYTDMPLADLVKIFDANMSAAKKSLQNANDEAMTKQSFVLKAGDQVLMQMPLIESISSTLNHWVHHRGQLTVYMRLCDIAVPSIYGPSADEKGF